jgi:antitoxin component HigA of HigAB toxin-antitoxin module
MKIIINNETDYNLALHLFNEVSDPNSPAQEELLEILTDAIEEYESEHYPIDEPSNKEGEL